jgi:uncharacterized membrane protein YdbT with pleckstrin-like domain
VGFPRRLLDDDEDLVLELRPHWWFFAGPAATVVASIVVAAAIASAGAHEIVQVPFIGVAVAAAAWLVARYVRWATSGVVLTSERLILVRGIAGRRSSELPLVRVAGVHVRQRLSDRLLGAGELVVTSAPDGATRNVTHVPRPRLVREEIERCAEGVVGRQAHGPPSASLAAELEHLDDLRRRGVLTEDEFRAGKARLLGGS